MKKKIIRKIIAFLLVLMIVLVSKEIIKNKIEEEKAQKLEMGITIYDNVYKLYLYGEGIEYEYDLENKRVYIEKEGTKYYKIKNYEYFVKTFSTNYIEEIVSSFNIIKEEGNYYLTDYGRGYPTSYYGTTISIEKISKKKIEYKAQSKFCKKDSIVTYGEGCTSDGYYIVEKPFILVKEDGLWKVSEYTSIFQFSDRELK